jgi:hypothetical protein
MFIRPLLAAVAMLVSLQVASAATLAQTVHFNGADAEQMFELYMTGEGHQAITGLPASYVDADGNAVERGVAGGQLMAFCFQPDQCGLNARVLDIQSAPGLHTVVMAWWNFGWLQAVDKADLTVEGRGAHDSILTLTFRDTLRGAQVELVQVNVPDFKVVIPNPDGTKDTGPLSQIVNTHWNTLYWDNLRGLVE